MPRLHRAKTVAWGLLKWGRCAWMVCVHSVTRGWQDILFLLGCMGYMATHTTPAGRHVLPLCIAGRNIIDSKTYPRKGFLGGWRRLTAPLARLAEVTTHLPEKLLRHQAIAWPYSLVTDIEALAGTFRAL